MEERQLNEKESLELIARMIQNTQQKLEKEHALPLLIFGYITIGVSIAVWYALKQTQNQLWNLLWFLIPVLGFIILYVINGKKKAIVRTFVDKVVNYVWLICGGTVVIASITPTFGARMPILFVVALVIGIGTTLTGAITKVALLKVTGVIGILTSFALFWIQGLSPILFFAGIFLVMMVIPGHILYVKGRR